MSSCYVFLLKFIQLFIYYCFFIIIYHLLKRIYDEIDTFFKDLMKVEVVIEDLKTGKCYMIVAHIPQTMSFLDFVCME